MQGSLRHARFKGFPLERAYGEKRRTTSTVHPQN